MTALSNSSLVISRSPSVDFSSGSSLKSADQFVRPTNLALSFKGDRRPCTQRRVLTVQARYSDGGRTNSGSIFVSGFVLGGIIVGTLGCVYAPQISKALTGTDKKDLMKKLPKFIYDEEKALEKQRKKLAEKIAQLNDAIDNVSTQLRSEEPPNGAAVSSDDIEALI
ncbi:inner membrane localized protein [Perilla frutescens var. hirtella]|nr:inner membrane localized protein [Perilla frutescens var. frutescens]KAH6786650.1 inner membrane localized protein [Perilla frutescens var. hirtella]